MAILASVVVVLSIACVFPRAVNCLSVVSITDVGCLSTGVDWSIVTGGRSAVDGRSVCSFVLSVGVCGWIVVGMKY